MLSIKNCNNWPCSFKENDENEKLLTNDRRRWAKINCDWSPEWLRWPKIIYWLKKKQDINHLPKIDTNINDLLTNKNNLAQQKICLYYNHESIKLKRKSVYINILNYFQRDVNGKSNWPIRDLWIAGKAETTQGKKLILIYTFKGNICGTKIF